jgi:hypothetical protein
MYIWTVTASELPRIEKQRETIEDEVIGRRRK